MTDRPSVAGIKFS